MPRADADEPAPPDEDAKKSGAIGRAALRSHCGSRLEIFAPPKKFSPRSRSLVGGSGIVGVMSPRTWIVAAVCAAWTAAVPGAAAPAPASRCAAPEYHQFDFWAGDWDAYDADDLSKPAARVHVDAIVDGCALREDYRGTNGLVGQSLNIYDSVRKVWHQSWVTNRGQLLVLEGGLHDGRMTLRANEPTEKGP